MARTQELHRSHLLKALGVEFHDLRNWLDLEPLASRPRRERTATAYTTIDLLFLMVIQRLDAAGLKPQALRSFSNGLYKLLQQRPGKNDTLEIHQESDANWKIGPAPAGSGAMELKMPLAPVRRQILLYTGAHLVSGQQEMLLLTTLDGARAGTAARRRRA